MRKINLGHIKRKTIACSKQLLKLLLLVSVFNSPSIMGQTDSLSIQNRTNLETIISDKSTNNKEKLLLLKKLAALYEKKDAKQASIIYERVVSIAHKLKSPHQIEEGYLHLAKTYQELFQYSRADSIYRILSPYYTKNKEKQIAEFYFLRGINFYMWSKYKIAAKYFQNARKIYEKLGIVAGQAKTLKEEAKVWANYNDYAKTIGLLQRSADMYKQLGDEEGLASIETLMGTIMESWGKLERAKTYFNQAYKYALKRNDLFEQSNNLLHIGDIEVLEENYNKAISDYKTAMKLSLIIHHDKLYSIALSNLGEAYYHLRQYDSALYYQKLTLPIKKRIADRRRLAISMYDLSLIYFQQNRLKKATAYADSALMYAESIQSKELEMNALLVLSDINKASHRFRTAYDYLKLYVKVNNEIFSENNRKMVSQMEVRYEADQKERENQLLRELDTENKLRLEKEKNRTNLLYILLGFLFTIIIIVSLFLHYRRKLKNKQHAIELKNTREIKKQSIELKRLTNELMVSREKYKSIVENATIGIYKTTPDGRIIFTNNTLCRMLGYTEKELKRINLNAEKPNRHAFIKLLEEQGVITGREDTWTTADGKNIFVKESAWVIRDTSGKVLNYEGMIEDITQQKKAEEQVALANKRLKNINKELRSRNIAYKEAKTEAEEANRAKTLFLANISHEIRTPLNSIIGYTDLLYPMLKDENQINYLKSIKTSSHNLLLLINDILDLSKIQEGKLEINEEPCSFEELISETQTFFFPLVEKKGITLKTQIDETLQGLFLIDKVRIRQILFNLVGNAVKFTDRGFVQLTMAVQNVDESKQLYEIKIDIQDSGRGIPAEEQESIFKPFEQSSNPELRKVGGTGLGLNIAKRLVEIMGGTIRLKSEEGKGSTFTVLLYKIKKTAHVKFNKETNQTIKQGKAQKQNTVIDSKLTKLLSHNFYDQWLRVQKHMFISEIKRFGEQLLDFSRQNKIKTLEKEMNKLLKACKNYDIETIEIIFQKISLYFNQK
jgi:PAS domain S-box-containing protein